MVNLTPGDHEIEWSLDGHETLIAIINISSTGAVSCINVIVGTCLDKISIIGNTVSAMLKAITEAPTNICEWIVSKNGANSVASYDIIELVREYVQPGGLDFTISTSDIMGLVAYYNNQLTSGNALTGCEFT